MGRDREQISAKRVEVDRRAARGLSCIDVNEHTALTAGAHHLADRLHGAHLVVAPLQMDQSGAGSHRGQDLVGIHPAHVVDADDTHLAVRRRREADRRVLHCRHDLVCAPLGRAPARRGDRLGGARGEDDLAWPAPSRAATCSRACSTAARAVMPSEWILPGSPPGVRSQAVTVSTTSGRAGDVEAWSR